MVSRSEVADQGVLRISIFCAIVHCHPCHRAFCFCHSKRCSLCWAVLPYLGSAESRIVLLGREEEAGCQKNVNAEIDQVLQTERLKGNWRRVARRYECCFSRFPCDTGLCAFNVGFSSLAYSPNTKLIPGSQQVEQNDNVIVSPSSCIFLPWLLRERHYIRVHLGYFEPRIVR